MPQLTLRDLTIAFGDATLLDKVELTVDSGQRIGLIGRNGEGKSTLLKIIAGETTPDAGAVQPAPGITVGMLSQTSEVRPGTSVFDYVAMGLGDIGRVLTEIRAATNTAADHNNRMDSLHRQLDEEKGWALHARVEKTLDRLGLDGSTDVATLSGGWQRRVSLARALVAEPGVLLLDEPTNHLDIETIAWLEKQLLRFRGAIIFVTHDRAFLQNLATDIVELDRGQLVRWPGTYTDYLRRKESALESESRKNAEFDRKLAKEEQWIRQGIKARRTRNEGRVRALQKMRDERRKRRDAKGNSRMTLDSSSQSGKLVIEANDLVFRHNDQIIINNFSSRIQRGDRIGLIGPNGCGKSTLLRLLLRELEPAEGSVQHGTKLEIAYLDQLRKELRPESTVIDIIGQGREEITIGGKRKHVISYLADFLFSPARSRSPIRSLSGGERARVLLALLFSRPANLLVMDEPTNDLDIETLELLEELLLQFEGTLLLVSHDRKFLDNVVTGTFVFEGNGKVSEFVGGYSDWMRRVANTNESQPVRTQKNTQPAKPKNRAANKPGYREQQELSKLPDRIEELEQEQGALTAAISEPGFYELPADTIRSTLDRMQVVSDDLERCYQRWDELES